MSDSQVNPYEKPGKLHIKLPPIHIEVIQARSSVRYSAENLLRDVAEKSFPQVTYNDEVIEKLHALGKAPEQNVPASEPIPRPTMPGKTETADNEMSTGAALAQAPSLNPGRQQEKSAQDLVQEVPIGDKQVIPDIDVIRQAVSASYERKKAA